jgi:ATP-dependent DNA ligase
MLQVSRPRHLGIRSPDSVQPRTALGGHWASDFPTIGAAMVRLPVKSIIIDGEAVCLLEDGRPDFHALRSRQACQDAPDRL